MTSLSYRNILFFEKSICPKGKYKLLAINSTLIAVYENGTVYDCYRRCWRKMFVDKNGYRYLTVGNRYIKLHRLVLYAFVGPARQGKDVARHLDGNTANNAKRNLTWGTHKENWADRRIHGTDNVGSKRSHKTVRLMSIARTSYWRRKRVA